MAAFYIFMAFVVIFLICAAAVMWRDGSKTPSVAVAICVLFFVGLTIAVVVLDNNNKANDRQATSEIEARNHVRIIKVSTEDGEIRYEDNGRICDGKIIEYNDQFFLADNPTCANLSN